MALPSSGQITFQDIATELGLTGPISLDQAEVRALAGIPSGPISLADLAGKSALLFSGTLTIGFKAEVIDKLSTPELRGFWTYNMEMLITTGGSLTPLTVLGNQILSVYESRGLTSNSNSKSVFRLLVAGHTIPLDFFSDLKIKNGSTVVNTFSRASATATRGTANLGYSDAVDATIFSWQLPSNAAGQVFPTSGTRTLEIS